MSGSRKKHGSNGKRKNGTTRQKRGSRGSKGKRSSGKRASRKRQGSGTKQTWEQFLKHKDSRNMLKDAWNHKNPEKKFGDTIRKLHRKYSSKKKR